MTLAIELDQRATVVAQSRRWRGTPYHHRAALLGVGVDCAQLLLQAFADAGLIAPFDPGEYNCDWHLHRSEERYLKTIEEYATQVDPDETPLSQRKPLPLIKPGNILMWRVGRTFSHSAIVTEWPFIIHAYLPSRIVEEVDVRGTPMAERPIRIFSYWGT